MKVSKVRVGIVGLGLAANAHLKAYSNNISAEVVAVCDLDKARAEAIAEKYKIPKTFTSFKKMLLDDEINTIDITTPTYLHAPMVIEAARARKNILCEKPLCLTLQEGNKILQEVAKASVFLMVGESYVFMTSIMKANELIMTGEIGKPQQIRQRFGTWNERPGVLDTERKLSENFRGWRMRSEKAGGSGYPWMFDHFVHFFATAELLMNGSKIDKVYAIKSDISWMRDTREISESQLGMHVYQPEESFDIPIVTWSYEDEACQGVWMRAEALNGKYDPMFGFSATVLGSHGMVEVLGEGGSGLNWNGNPVHLILHRKNKETSVFRFEEGEDDIWQSEVSYYSCAHQNQINEFISALTSGVPPKYSGSEGIWAVKATMATICSAKEGQPVKVKEITDERYLK